MGLDKNIVKRFEDPETSDAEAVEILRGIAAGNCAKEFPAAPEKTVSHMVMEVVVSIVIIAILTFLAIHILND